MSIAILNEAAQLIREMDSHLPHIEGLGVRISEYLRRNDFVEGVGIFQAEDEVFFDPSCDGSMAIHAKVIASYGTSDGRVLYDIAVSFNGGETYAETIPFRDVVPAFIRAIPEATKSGIVPKVIESNGE